MWERLKQLWRRFKKWIIGILIPTAALVPLGSVPPEETTYKASWTYETSQLALNSCKCDAQERFDQVRAKWLEIRPEIKYTLLEDSKDYVKVEFYEEFHATSTEAAVAIVKYQLGKDYNALLEAQTLVGNYVDKYERGNIPK